MEVFVGQFKTNVNVGFDEKIGIDYSQHLQ